jgi:alkanesulfonate monooxygenase SsuD/methylene tetrahydromethanopterin reductase-like flavin-dependent oxidoreductase (luciferase family)
MQFGLHAFGHHRSDRPADENFTELLEQVRVAEQVGFDLVWAGHHYMMTDRQKFQVVPAMARIAGEAGDMQVGTAFLLPLHHPIVVAEQFATLDAITGGRAIIGPVAGYRDIEFDSLDIDKLDRVGRLHEGVEVIKRLWTEDAVTFDGEHFSFEDVTITPKPVQDPRPPIWVGANADAAVERASQLGDAWLCNPHADEPQLTRQLDLAETPSGSGFRGVSPARREVFVAPTDREAFEIYGPYIEAYYEWYKREGQAEAMEDPEALDQSLEDLAEDRFIIGSPETVADRLVTLETDVGVDCVLMGMHRPGIAHEDVVRSIELTGDEVMTRVEAAL